MLTKQEYEELLLFRERAVSLDSADGYQFTRRFYELGYIELINYRADVDEMAGIAHIYGDYIITAEGIKHLETYESSVKQKIKPENSKLSDQKTDRRFQTKLTIFSVAFGELLGFLTSHAESIFAFIRSLFTK